MNSMDEIVDRRMRECYRAGWTAGFVTAAGTVIVALIAYRVFA